MRFQTLEQQLPARRRHLAAKLPPIRLACHLQLLPLVFQARECVPQQRPARLGQLGRLALQTSSPLPLPVRAECIHFQIAFDLDSSREAGGFTHR